MPEKVASARTRFSLQRENGTLACSGSGSTGLSDDLVAVSSVRSGGHTK
jgi:hypothetical protein